MKKLFRLLPIVKEHSWGSPTAFSTFNVENPSGVPQGELWYGAHETGKSLVEESNGDYLPFDRFLVKNHEMLGCENPLPFLVKILAMEKPSSIQVHPVKELALKGFERESLDGVPLNSQLRVYKDCGGKDEIVAALGDEFWILVGYRPLKEVIADFKMLDFGAISEEVTALLSNPSADFLQSMFKIIDNLDEDIKTTLINDLIKI